MSCLAHFNVNHTHIYIFTLVQNKICLGGFRKKKSPISHLYALAFRTWSFNTFIRLQTQLKKTRFQNFSFEQTARCFLHTVSIFRNLRISLSTLAKIVVQRSATIDGITRRLEITTEDGALLDRRYLH